MRFRPLTASLLATIFASTMKYTLYLFESKIVLCSWARDLFGDTKKRRTSFSTTGKNDPRIKQALDRCRQHNYTIEVINREERRELGR